MDTPAPHRARFGAFELDLKTGELHKGGRRIMLQEQPFQLLRFLVERRGELATRDEIRGKLWPNDTVVEFDHAINTAIKKLREALGDPAGKPKYIETVARRGYRLISPVEWAAAIIPDAESSQPKTARLPDMPPPGAATLSGKKFSHYRVLEVLGGGGMGVVYRAEDIKLGRRVAVKFLPEELASNPLALQRFEREARAASALEHPNICPIYEFGEEHGQPFIVMPLLEGQTLRDRIAEGAALPIDQTLDLAVQIAKGLEAAHQKAIIHRDIKPANIFITNRGEARIMDFGLAKVGEPVSTAADELPPSLHVGQAVAPASIQLTRTGAALGTAPYMSPEQVRCEKLDVRTDLFSFGSVLYEMLCGRQAFPGVSSVEVMNAILKGDPPALPASVPPALATIVIRCLEKAQDRRFQSAADVVLAIQPLSPALHAAPKRWPGLKWAALAAASVGTAYWLGVRPSRQSAPPETTLRRLTNDPGLTKNAAMSPDGKLVAYVRNGDIWVRQVDGSGVIRITDDPADDDDPSFSPDGAQIAFRSERRGGGIYTVSALGGEARESVPKGHRPRFSPDGRWLMYWTLIDGSERFFVQPLSGGPPTQVGAGCDLIQEAPVWSPDGSRILFKGACGSATPAAWVSTVDGRDLKSNRDLHADSIDQWIADPPRVLIRVRVADATYITSVPVSADATKVTGPPQRLTSVTDNVARVSAALNGRVALSVSASATHIWGLPIDSKGQVTGEPKQLTYGSAGENNPALSRDGGKLAFISTRANNVRLFYRNLATGSEEELSASGDSSDTPIFNPEGTGIMWMQYPDPAGWRNFFCYAPLSGGLSKKIWDNLAWAGMLDWAPNGKTLLFLSREDFSKPMQGIIRQLDLNSLSATTLLEDPELNLWQGHFSNDGRWITFNATKRDSRMSRVYIVPFRKALLPRSAWIAVTQGDWDDKPRFSSDNKLIFFVTGEDAPHRVWAQRVGSDMRPDGRPVPVYPPPHSQRPAVMSGEIAVGPHLIVFTEPEVNGNIWLLEASKRDTH